MRIGYSYWGYLGDLKFNFNKKIVSTPDGNATYSWSIIRELQKRGHEVVQVMPDRDMPGYSCLGDRLFKAFASDARIDAYNELVKMSCLRSYSDIDYGTLKDMWDYRKLNEADMILHEYRMLITGRNDEASRNEAGWQPDYFFQQCLFRYCEENDIELVLFDLDYKLSACEAKNLNDRLDLTIFELGEKWKQFDEFKSMKVYIPYDFDYINEFKPSFSPNVDLVYVGNRYERDWCIDKYIPKDGECNVKVYGNWLEAGRDSDEMWPTIDFGERIQVADFSEVYGDSMTTVLLAKKEYCKYGFMTMRLLESIVFGSLPFIIEEFSDEVIDDIFGTKKYSLLVHNSDDVVANIDHMRGNVTERFTLLANLRQDLSRRFDVKHFVNALLLREDTTFARKKFDFRKHMFNPGVENGYPRNVYSEV